MNDEAILQAVRELAAAFTKLNDLTDAVDETRVNSTISGAYPFHLDLNEMTLQVGEWVEFVADAVNF